MVTDPKIALIKSLVPERMYNFEQLAHLFRCHKNTIAYQVELYEVPTIKITGTPFILQESIVAWFLKADERNRNAGKNCGFDSVLDAMRQK
jgi:hypothetical protein